MNVKGKRVLTIDFAVVAQALACLLIPAVAQALGYEVPNAPKVSVKLPASAKAGQTVSGTVLVTIAGGLHAYQNPPSQDYMIPLSVSVTGAKLKAAKYPAGKAENMVGEKAPVRVYEGTVRIPVSIVLPKKHGKQQIAFKVHYQECNDKACFPPGDVTAKAAINVR